MIGYSLRFSEILRSIRRYVITDVSGQPIGPNSHFLFGCLTVEDGIDMFSRNVAN